jgi:hypothetical protein
LAREDGARGQVRSGGAHKSRFEAIAGKDGGTLAKW